MACVPPLLLLLHPSYAHLQLHLLAIDFLSNNGGKLGFLDLFFIQFILQRLLDNA